MHWSQKPGFIYRTVHLHHPRPERSSVAADLVASAPGLLHVEACERDKAQGPTICAHLSRWAGHSGCVQWFDSGPPRDTFDLWDLGAHIVVDDASASGGNLRVLHNDEKEVSLRLVCVRPIEADLIMARQLVEAGLAAGWTFLILHDDHNGSITQSDFEALGPVVPASFHFRTSREGRDRSPSVTGTVKGSQAYRLAQLMTRVELSDRAIAEGAELWKWLGPRLKTDLITREVANPVTHGVANDP